MIFDDLIHPISRDDFFNNYFEKQPLYTGKVCNDYESVLRIEDLDAIINNSILSPAEFRIAKDGNILQSSLFTDKNFKRKSQDDYINFSKALALYAEGATMVFESLHERVKGLGDFCQHLEELFQNNVQSNIYLTPPGSKGFARHFDTHEVFVLQIAGTKEWIIYDNPPIKLPVSTQSHHPFKDVEYPIKHQFVLKPGEGVYIPRGYMHEAKSNKDLSLHVTFGMVTYNYVDFIIDLLHECKHDNSNLRESLPTELLRGNQESFNSADILESTFKSLNSPELINKVVSKRRSFFLSSRTPRIEKGLFNLSSIKGISSATRFRKVKELPYSLSSQDDKILLKVFNKTITFPLGIHPFLEYILQSEFFTRDQLDDSLSDSSKTVLIEKLIKESIIEIESL